ncbi:hypothetical protein C8J57DRAFT_1600066 [Mycena rebaudengoi]|nr:hypothetical protein C8J57DRAFT_1600066 [Mycena rebaudengoi]
MILLALLLLLWTRKRRRTATAIVTPLELHGDTRPRAISKVSIRPPLQENRRPRELTVDVPEFENPARPVFGSANASPQSPTSIGTPENEGTTTMTILRALIARVDALDADRNPPGYSPA